MSLPKAAARFHKKRANLATAREELRAEVLAALDAGLSEVEVAKVAGVNRLTIRAWRKEQPPEN